MDRQPILDKLALIAGGGPTVGDPAGIYRGAGGIVTADGKKIDVAYSSLRSVAEMQNDRFVHVCWADETGPVPFGSDVNRVVHRLVMQVLVSVSIADMRGAIRMLEAFVPAYYAAYNSVTLGGVITNGAIVNCRGPRGVEPIYPERHALEFIYEAQAKGVYQRVA
jgi:hypothetical protein